MSEKIVQLKAEFYDIMVNMEKTKVLFDALTKRKNEVIIQIEDLNKVDKVELPLKPSLEEELKQKEELRIKEQKIIEKRLNRIIPVNQKRKEKK